MRDINLTQEFDYALLSDVQRMDGYNPPLFYNLGDYIAHLCADQNLLDAFNRQLELTVPYKAHDALNMPTRKHTKRPFSAKNCKNY